MHKLGKATPKEAGATDSSILTSMGHPHIAEASAPVARSTSVWEPANVFAMVHLGLYFRYRPGLIEIWAPRLSSRAHVSKVYLACDFVFVFF